MVQKTVLHIDDDPDDRFFVASALTQISNTLILREAKNGNEGINYLEACKALNSFPCLVLLDMNMPMMNGIQIIEKIRKDPLLSEIPLVLFTTTPTLPDLDAGNLNSFGVKLVRKPAGYDEFVDCLNGLLQEYQIS